MWNRIIASMTSWFTNARTGRDLCRLDCRCLEDMGLNPKDVAVGLGRSCHRLRHHPSWDNDLRHVKRAACLREY
jgi:uncharacterized protein YjiS (DUF1127 family)